MDTTPLFPAASAALSPPLPTSQHEPLLRGPLILTAVSRVLSTSLYFFIACAATKGLPPLFARYRFSAPLYLTDMVLLAASMWIFVLFNLLLTWLFFSRRWMFRPLMIYYTLFLPALVVCIGVHATHYPVHPRSHQPDTAGATAFAWMVLSTAFSALFWPFYYTFSPRMKRVFTH